MDSTFDWGTALPRLVAPRLVLRWVTTRDAPALFAVFGDPEVMRYWSTPPQRDVDEARTYIDEIHALFETRELFQWGIVDPESDELYGTCTLCQIDPTHRRAEIGFVIGRSAWGRGLASEAVETLFDFAFNVLGLHRLEADVDPRNERSLRLLERQGFRREGYMREKWQIGGETQDSVILGLLRPEWKRG